MLPVSLDCPFLVGYSVFSDIYLKLEAHLVIQAQFVFNQVYFLKIIFLYVKHCPAVVATLHIPSIHKQIQKFCRDVTMRDIDHEHQK